MLFIRLEPSIRLAVMISVLLTWLFLDSMLVRSRPVLQFCDTRVNYTNGSNYQTNLRQLLSPLPARGSNTGFYQGTAGSGFDRVFGLVQCSGDVSADVCRSCINRTSTEITRICANQREAALRYDECLLHYADWRFFSQLNMEKLSFRNPQNVSADPVPFGKKDMVNSDCLRCLQNFVTQIPDCCNGSQGAQVLGLSCNLRYEIHPFYQISQRTLPPANNSRRKGNNLSSKIVPIIAAIIGVILVLVAGIFIWILKRKQALRIKADAIDGEEIRKAEVLLYDLGTLRSATGNFSDENKLGQGGFGPVYKGKLSNGQEVAVKMLSRSSGQGIQELKNEVILLAKLQHVNLVRLLGCCLDEQEKMLVYEYVPNSSLDKFLFDDTKRLQLDWERRFRIICGIARGLLYLHRDSRLRIIHRDLKAGNILLDTDMNPKISDFGLAKLFGSEATHNNTSRIAGTYGYMAPEYAKNGVFSTKSDVFSFGVLVLEIVMGRKNSSFSESEDSTNLLSYAWNHWNKGTMTEMIDTSMHYYHPSEALRCIQIGLLCVQDDSSLRPFMSDVVFMLDGRSVGIPAPSKPAFFVAQNAEKEDGSLDDSVFRIGDSDKNSIRQPVNDSVNEMSITEFYPR
ncbi:cysteine-rich receptor-like protein kinase 10 isoform X2 [Aristolochia californica]|uniref:cysteine-rich receptor-like protein kinase 10 isoform X2 n=1 Tax=Aristolochia californica TaxID=171875 RepID=UPI0035DED183